MCLILIAYDCDPRYKLVLAANRDEFYNRPTMALHEWPEVPGLFAGKDLLEGGTWMGVTRTGLFAALTNYRDQSHMPHAPSRGHLVQKFLEKEISAENYTMDLTRYHSQYNGYNMLVGTFESLLYISNRDNKVRPISQGIHGLSNNLLDIPWPKVTRGKQYLQKCLEEPVLNIENIFEFMADKTQAADQDLPRTGVPLMWERLLSSIFIESENYGTRSTSVLLVDQNNSVQLWERTFLPQGSGQCQEVHFLFQLPNLR